MVSMPLHSWQQGVISGGNNRKVLCLDEMVKRPVACNLVMTSSTGTDAVK